MCYYDVGVLWYPQKARQKRRENRSSPRMKLVLRREDFDAGSCLNVTDYHMTTTDRSQEEKGF